MNNVRGNSHNMGNPTLLIAPLPKRSELCGLMIYVGRPPNTSQHARTAYQWLVLKCRMLIFSENQILSSPVLYSDTSLYVIASKTFIASGQLKKLLDCYGFTECNEAGCQRIPVTDSLLQTCLKYTLKARLAPMWNQLGANLLVQGRDFLMETAPMSAIKIEFIVQGDQVILSIVPQRVKVPHLQLSDLEIAPKTIKMFLTQQVSTLFGHSIGREWLCTLPGFRNGRVLSISHQIPPTCPFLTYQHMKRHWKNMYGFRLPEQQPGATCSPAGPYITISFKKRLCPEDIGYTYPALCVRPQNPMFLPNVDQHAIVQAFTGDLSSRLLNLCGIPFSMSIKLGYFQPDLLPAHHQILGTSQTTPANFTAISLNSLPRGYRTQLEKTPSVGEENQSLPCTNLNLANNVTRPPIQDNKISSVSEKTMTINYPSRDATDIVQSSQDPQQVAGNITQHKEATAAVCTRSESLPCIDSCQYEASDAEIVGGQVSSTPQPSQSATCALTKAGNKLSSRSKWDFPKIEQSPQQETTTCETSERKLYKPVFTKKKKAGADLKRKESEVKNCNVTAQNTDLQLQEPKVYKVDTIPQCEAFKHQYLLSDSSAGATKIYMPKGINSATNLPCPSQKFTQQKTNCQTKINDQIVEDSPPAKKSRASKPELSLQDVEKLAREGKFEKLSVAVLSKWLKHHNVGVKVKDKKSVLIEKVNEYLKQ